MRPPSRTVVEELDHGPRTLYPVIIGDKGRPYYLARFAAMEERGKFAPSWNWAAFLFGYWWLLHRKMYAYALVFVGIVAALVGNGPGAPDILLLPQVMAYRTVFSGGDILLGDLVYAVLGHIAFPVAANSLYFFHVQRKADRLWETYPDATALESALSRKAGPTKLEWTLSGLCVVLIVLMLGSVFVLPVIQNSRYMESVTIPLIEALDRYRADNKSYPDTLEKLMPTYIQELPELPGCNTQSQSQWYFVDKKSGGYSLVCGTGMFMWHEYNSETRKWRGGGS